MRFTATPAILIALASIALNACDTPRDVSYVRATDLDKSGRYEEAAELYRFVAAGENYSGRQAAAFRLAEMYFRGEGVAKDEAAGLRLMEQAARGPDTSWRRLANYKLGGLAEEGIPGYLERNRITALGYFQKAAADGDKLAQEKIEYLRNFPDVFVELNKAEFTAQPSAVSPGGMERAYELFKASAFDRALPIFMFHAKIGSSEAQYALALMYRNGWGVTTDEARFKGWCFISARNGHRAAQRELGRLLYLEKDLVNAGAEAEYWLNRAAEQNDVEAVRLLGLVALSPHQDRAPNLQLALSRFEAAAAQGSASAMLNLGDLYMGNLGLPKDIEKARAYYMAAADAGDPEARVRLFKEFNVVYDGTAARGDKAPSKSSATPRQGDSPVATIRPILPAPSVYAPPSPPSSAAAAVVPPKPSLVDLFAMLSPAVVQIVAINIKADRTEDISQGSGVVIRPDLVLTNCHVLEGTNAVGTKVNDRIVMFKPVAGDRNRDLCLLWTDQPLQPVGKSRRFDSLKVGERVFAIGSPSGLDNTVTEGIISGLRRSGGIRYIQTSAPISPGSSGGGLFDEYGSLIGITTFKLSGANLKFAVAIDESDPVVAGVK